MCFKDFFKLAEDFLTSVLPSSGTASAGISLVYPADMFSPHILPGSSTPDPDSAAPITALGLLQAIAGYPGHRTLERELFAPAPDKGLSF
jgi:hypothetical protein